MSGKGDANNRIRDWRRYWNEHDRIFGHREVEDDRDTDADMAGGEVDRQSNTDDDQPDVDGLETTDR